MRHIISNITTSIMVFFFQFICAEEAYQSMQSYEARAEDELSFDIGVTLKVVEKNLDGWWLAR